MLRPLIAGLALGAIVTGPAGAVGSQQSSDEQRPVYVQIIVKACQRAETPLEPTNHGKSYDDEKPLSIEERKANLVALGCIDVPVPMERMGADMTPEACRGHAGYIAAMQFLEQRQDLADFPAVGAWGCHTTDYEVVGAASQ